MKWYNDTGDSFLMSGPNVEFLKDCVSQALKIDDKDSEQLSPFVSQGIPPKSILMILLQQNAFLNF